MFLWTLPVRLVPATHRGGVGRGRERGWGTTEPVKHMHTPMHMYIQWCVPDSLTCDVQESGHTVDIENICTCTYCARTCTVYVHVYSQVRRLLQAAPL